MYIPILVASLVIGVFSEQLYLGHRTAKPSSGTICPPGMAYLKCEQFEYNSTAVMYSCTFYGNERVTAFAHLVPKTAGGDAKYVSYWYASAPVAVVLVKCGLYDNVYAYWPETTEMPPDADALKCFQNKDISHVGMCIAPRVDILVDAQTNMLPQWTFTKDVVPSSLKLPLYATLGVAVETIQWSMAVDAQTAFGTLNGTVAVYNRWGSSTLILYVAVYLGCPTAGALQVLLAATSPPIVLGPGEVFDGFGPFVFSVNASCGHIVVEVVAAHPSYPCVLGNGTLSMDEYIDTLSALFISPGYTPGTPGPYPPCGLVSSLNDNNWTTPCVVATDQAIFENGTAAGPEIVIVPEPICTSYTVEREMHYDNVICNATFYDIARLYLYTNVVGTASAHIFIYKDRVTGPPNNSCVYDIVRWQTFTANMTMTPALCIFFTEELTRGYQLVLGAVGNPAPNGVVPIGMYVFENNAVPHHTLVANTTEDVHALLTGTWHAGMCTHPHATTVPLRVRLVQELTAAELNIAWITGRQPGTCSVFIPADVCAAVTDAHTIIATFGCEDWHEEITTMFSTVTYYERAREVYVLLKLWNLGCTPYQYPC